MALFRSRRCIVAGAMVLLAAAEAWPGCSHEIVFEPFRGLILVPVEVNGSPRLHFFLDSGSNMSGLSDVHLAQALGLDLAQQASARGMGRGAVDAQIASGVLLTSVGAELYRGQVAVSHLGPEIRQLVGRDIHGLLGAELFARFVVEIDPVHQRLLLHDPAEFTYSGPGSVVPMKIKDGRPVVRATVSISGRRRVRIDLLVDTGSAAVLTLIEDSHRALRRPEGSQPVTTFGIAGRCPAHRAMVRAATVGGVTLTAESANFVLRKYMPVAIRIPKLNGVLGNGFLSRYHCYLDLPGKRLILEEAGALGP